MAINKIQHECFKMGTPLKFLHRKVAPGQFDFASEYGINTVQINKNLIAIQVIKEVATNLGIVTLLQEKPFAIINVPGKNNNWSISNNSTDSGVLLFLSVPLNKITSNGVAFPCFMAAVVTTLNDHGNLLRMYIASPWKGVSLGITGVSLAIMST